MLPWRNCVLGPSNRSQIVAMLVEALGGPPESALALIETLIPRGSVRITRELCKEICYQLAANKTAILRGIPVRPFTGVPEAQWVPLQIESCDPAESRGATPMSALLLRVLDGPYAGHPATRRTPTGYLYIFSKSLGFSWKRRYEGPHDLSGFRFAAWVEPSVRSDLQFDKFWFTSSMTAHNKALVKKLKPTEKELECQTT
jgi:hypothetical protein